MAPVINFEVAQLLTLKWPKRGPVINFTAYIYIYIFFFFSLSLSLPPSLSVLHVSLFSARLCSESVSLFFICSLSLSLSFSPWLSVSLFPLSLHVRSALLLFVFLLLLLLLLLLLCRLFLLHLHYFVSLLSVVHIIIFSFCPLSSLFFCPLLCCSFSLSRFSLLPKLSLYEQRQFYANKAKQKRATFVRNAPKQ